MQKKNRCSEYVFDIISHIQNEQNSDICTTYMAAVQEGCYGTGHRAESEAESEAENEQEGVEIMQTGNYAGTAQIYRYQNSLDHYHRMDRRRTRHEKRTKRLISVLVTAVIVLSAILLCLIVSLRKTEAVDRDLYKYYTTVEADQGDSLWTIAEENLTPGYRDCNELVDEIAAINHLTDTHIDVGQKLVVPYYSAVYKE